MESFPINQSEQSSDHLNDEMLLVYESILESAGYFVFPFMKVFFLSGKHSDMESDYSSEVTNLARAKNPGEDLQKLHFLTAGT